MEIALLATAFVLGKFAVADVGFLYPILMISLVGSLNLNLFSIRNFYGDLFFLALGVVGLVMIKAIGDGPVFFIVFPVFGLLGLGVSGACTLVRRLVANLLLR
ncbi:hypothetical protein GCM10028828_19900 [Corynebacterium tapiri]